MDISIIIANQVDCICMFNIYIFLSRDFGRCGNCVLDWVIHFAFVTTEPSKKRGKGAMFSFEPIPLPGLCKCAENT